MARWLIALAILCGATGGIVLGALNPGVVTFDAGLIDWSAPLGTIVIAATAAGFACGFAVAVSLGLLRRRNAGRSQRELRTRMGEHTASLPDE